MSTTPFSALVQTGGDKVNTSMVQCEFNTKDQIQAFLRIVLQSPFHFEQFLHLKGFFCHHLTSVVCQDHAIILYLISENFQ